ncbi:MAG TPA: 1,2-phenylacetyl-CoA epoxidase subunit B [Chloroflexota bacterium]|nr:1,2-phenylacetyl-CoA epoxidase subunit B [Chloroflexota bacterium]
MSGIYEVFQRKGTTEPIVHVGSVNAGDTRLALLLAKECFFRREHPSEIWVVRREDLHPLVETDVLEPGSDKSYRSIEAYTGIGKKRERVESSLP